MKVHAEKLVSLLTSREKDTLTLVTLGHSTKSIACVFDISPRTVEIHRGNAFRKINAVSTADAVRIGVYAGLDLQEDQTDPAHLSESQA
ncbi:LuxR C-terminal-related transcriptional regulator [Aurantiacibacter rhizosphaerae]